MRSERGPHRMIATLCLAMRRFTTLLLLACFVWSLSICAARAEDAPAPTLEQTVERLNRCGVPGSLTSRLLALVLEGELERKDAEEIAGALLLPCEEGLPMEPFADKTAEGFSKRVQPARLCRVLRAKLDDYRSARSLLAPLAQPEGSPLLPEVLRSAGESLALGLPRSEAESLVSAHRHASPELLAVGLRVLALMRQTDYPQELARDIVDTGIVSKTLTPEWEYLSRVALQAQQRGISEQQLKQEALEALREGQGLRGLMARLGAVPRDPVGADRIP
ncbi:MAG: hypothetical protein AB7E32_04245 [Desulfovibrio sp.]